uniref:Uncharacterized protein n=1 Tax=Chlamydomonas leiostraca TaxID=1034604 RepID=A0A7S0RVE5_9CHLO|mmetsp:Transcript_32717/g.83003  ORF Transcript_32717/g.83003 Transcript_32717/m.83003 type:complete len:148 (+) Transcript_32717:127-570(+)|eukprot:CAMPEP_0202867832 /NCGR_PEP_ID=MMETSP1391-20130828/9647_1 /ASSEMBLY_ACC=CAM_ASM_000867 /TAXON_ID=1034604 /ORGANISM="Chlamydomonas leiostraca, Strain SAG 11-49" /LENGTH=147 /DNA_ID=CAMNT_0049547907 /DNA_START=127 /DNA_END=570 /DNA_ORIENTATION=-
MALLSNPKLDAVAKNSIWEEHVRKENKTISLGETFSISDPRKMDILPEKPNRTVPAPQPDPKDVASASALLHELSSLKDTDKMPHERFALPVTGNMEYGFFSTRPLVPTNPMFDYKTRSCDVTNFATVFVNSIGHSPFARTDGPTSK